MLLHSLLTEQPQPNLCCKRNLELQALDLKQTHVWKVVIVYFMNLFRILLNNEITDINRREGKTLLQKR